RVILGTHTSGAEQNHLMVANVHLPLPDAEIDVRRYDEERGELGGFGGVQAKVEVVVKINHEGEVNRARYMPQNPFVIASKGPSPDVLVFDMSKHPSVPDAGSKVRPEHRCKGHTKEGFGLDWNANVEGQLLSGCNDRTICMWDVAADAKSVLQPVRTWTAHTGAVEDVAWHAKNPTTFASVGDDKRLLVWDAAIAGDNTVKSVMNTLHVLEGHRDEVCQLVCCSLVQWSPFKESVLASCGADRRVCIWDMARIGEEQTAEDAEDGPPELLFIHGGHTAKVVDFRRVKQTE
ncbi:unnamed protein product, partial [Phaeothamnion confervicola]